SVAAAVCAASWLEEEDLARFRAAWVEPLSTGYRGYEVVELPPPTQGVAALEALALLEGLSPDLANQVACAALALEDARAHVRDGALVGPFGVMGGLIQAQAHLQLVSALVDDGLDPQAALDRARFRVEAGFVRLEEGLWGRAGELEQLGHHVVYDEDAFGFGGGQAIVVAGDALLGGSDPDRKSTRL